MKSILKKSIFGILPLIIILPMIFLLFAMTQADGKAEKQSPQYGILDLSNWNPSQDGLISLNGEWEFFWQKLLTYDDFLGSSTKPDILAQVPKVWNTYKFEGKNLPGFGYATYRLHVTSAQAGQTLAIRMPTVSTAYNLFINDKLIASNGSVGIDKQHSVPEYRPVVAEFFPPSKDFEIILQVANFSYARGGAWYPIIIGSAENVLYYDKTIGYKDLFLIGAFLIMALYYLCIFSMRKDDKGSLYFVLMCLIAIGRTVIYGDYTINRIFPSNGYPVIVVIDYVTAIWFPVVFVSLIRELFPKQTSQKVKRLFIIYAMIMSLLVMLSPISFFTNLTYLIEAAIFSIAVYAVACIIRAFTKAADSFLVFAGALALILGGIHDVLYQNNIISSSLGELSSFGFLIMLFLQAYILAKRFKESVETAIASELRFLQAQIKPHFLYNTINTVVSISRYDPDQARKLLIDFSNYLRHSFDIKGLNQTVPLKNEIELVKAYLDIEMAQYEERLEVSFEVCNEADARVPILMLQPVVENAVLHGVLSKREGGRIGVFVKRDKKILIFTVKDNGVGMEQEKLRGILESESGSGVGLSNIDGRLKKLYGKGLQISSIPGVGTEVTWFIPVNSSESV